MHNLVVATSTRGFAPWPSVLVHGAQGPWTLVHCTLGASPQWTLHSVHRAFGPAHTVRYVLVARQAGHPCLSSNMHYGRRPTSSVHWRLRGEAPKLHSLLVGLRPLRGMMDGLKGTTFSSKYAQIGHPQGKHREATFSTI